MKNEGVVSYSLYEELLDLSNDMADLIDILFEKYKMVLFDDELLEKQKKIVEKSKKYQKLAQCNMWEYKEGEVN